MLVVVGFLKLFVRSPGSRTAKDKIDKQLKKKFYTWELRFQFPELSFNESPFRVLLCEGKGTFP